MKIGIAMASRDRPIQAMQTLQWLHSQAASQPFLALRLDEDDDCEVGLRQFAYYTWHHRDVTVLTKARTIRGVAHPLNDAVRACQDAGCDVIVPLPDDVQEIERHWDVTLGMVAAATDEPVLFEVAQRYPAASAKLLAALGFYAHPAYQHFCFGKDLSEIARLANCAVKFTPPLFKIGAPGGPTGDQLEADTAAFAQRKLGRAEDAQKLIAGPIE